MIRVSSPVVLVQPTEMSSLPRQDEHETLETLFQNVGLNLGETQARERFHTTGPADHLATPSASSEPSQ